MGIFMSLETGGLWMRRDTSGLLEELMMSLILLGNLRLINNKSLNLSNIDDSDEKLCLCVITKSLFLCFKDTVLDHLK